MWLFFLNSMTTKATNLFVHLELDQLSEKIFSFSCQLEALIASNILMYLYVIF